MDSVSNGAASVESACTILRPERKTKTSNMSAGLLYVNLATGALFHKQGEVIQLPVKASEGYDDTMHSARKDYGGSPSVPSIPGPSLSTDMGYLLKLSYHCIRLPI